jgi:SAM-dependent methyltransferase
LNQQQTLDRLLRNEADVAYKRRARLLIEYLDPQPGDHILDCGCGMGFYLYVLTELGKFHLTGYDGDPQAMAFARRQLAGRGVGLLFGDIQRLALPDAAFDKILFTEVLEHLDDDLGGLRQLWRVLRPGGTLALTVPNALYPFLWDPINRVLEDWFQRPIRTGTFAGIWANHVRLYTRPQLEEVVTGAGFVIEDVRWLTHYCFPFSHNIVYGIGKPLIQRGLLPDFIAKSAHRFRSTENDGSWWNPMNWALGMFNQVDRLNERSGLANNPHSMNIALRARKPE